MLAWLRQAKRTRSRAASRKRSAVNDLRRTSVYASVARRCTGPISATLRAPATFVVLFVCLTASATAPSPPELAGHWEGAIATVTGDLVVRVDLEAGPQGWSGTIDIPQQGADDLPLASIAVEGNAIRFAIAGVAGEPTFDGTFQDGEIRGTFTQTGSRLPFRLGREPLAGPARPQQPAPPHPYRLDEIRFASGAVELAGTLSLPPGAGPHPAVVLLSGSGPQDRDGEILGHRPLAVLADALTRRGIAVLRCDDRGVGGSSGSLATATTADLAQDALAAVAWLRGRGDLAAARIGLVGHSEGGVVAAIAASRSSEVGFAVLLATPGVPGRLLLPLQVRRLGEAGGASAGVVERQVALVEEGLELVARESDRERLRAGLLAVARRQLELLGGAAGASPEALESAVEREVEQLLTPWFRFFVTYDPTEALVRVRVPVLVVAGGRDLQVPPDQNLPPIVAALEAAGNREVTVHRLAGLNHLLQPATTGLPAEYYGIEETMAPEVLTLVGEWVERRAGPG